jgi:hypothetical protein
MKRFGVSLDVITSEEKMPDFFASPGIDSANLSSRRLRDGTLWRLESLDDEASLQEQVESIFALVPPANVKGNGVRAYLSIAVYYDTATCSMQIPPAFISMLQGSGISIEITCYPTSEERATSSSRSH